MGSRHMCLHARASIQRRNTWSRRVSRRQIGRPGMSGRDSIACGMHLPSWPSRHAPGRHTLVARVSSRTEQAAVASEVVPWAMAAALAEGGAGAATVGALAAWEAVAEAAALAGQAVVQLEAA